MDDLTEYYKEIPQWLIDKGKKWTEKNDFGYEWVDVDKIDEARKRSPVSVAVYAWTANELEEYVRLGNSNHYTLAYHKNPAGKILVFDSYENPFLKTLAKDHNVEYAQMYTLKKKLPDRSGRSFLKKIYDWFAWYLSEILK